MTTNIHNWLLAARPKTLIASILPVWIGFAISLRHPNFNGWWVIPILFAAVLIQVGTNIANDYYDYRKGADVKRSGPMRVTQSGLIPPRTVRNGFLLVFALALLLGIPLALRGGWSIVIIGSTSILCGVFYTAGPFPIAYKGLSEFFLIGFFGIIAVSGTSYLLTLEWSQLAMLAGVAPGLLSISLICVNNIRDIPTDREANKLTLPARFGYRFGRIEFFLSIVFSFFIAILILHQVNQLHRIYWLLPVLYFSVKPISIVFRTTIPEDLIQALILTARLQLIFGLSLGLAIAL